VQGSWIATAALLLSAASGCNSGSTPLAGGSSAAVQSGEAVQRREVGTQLFASAVDMLSRTDAFDEGSTDKAVAQLVRRLNESLDVLQPDAASDPLVDDDGKVLRETVWLRDCARHVVGNETDAVRRAERLFDWVVRNIQQIPENASADEAPPMVPWHILLLGRGKPLDQAWLFQLLARQQRLDVVILAYPDTDPKKPAEPHWWCAGLLDGGKLYLFDFRIGLPIAGPDGKGIATLEQAASDDKLLRAYDLPDRPYPVKTGDIGKMIALCETSGRNAAARYARFESQLSGGDRMQLTVDPKLPERVGKSAGIAEARAWPMRDVRFAASREKAAFDALKTQIFPFTVPDRQMLGGVYMNPPLWQARVRHVSGKFADPYTKRTTINGLYQQARPADAALNAKTDIGVAAWEGLSRMKQHATYWMGLVAYDLANYEAAAMYFEMVLKDKTNGGWTPGARYNLGRTYEAQNKPEKALETYRATFSDGTRDLPPDALCLQRAKRLK
jgi:hypothetical protein